MDKFEEIKKYKELLDSGIINKEEFDKKKEELLASRDGAVTSSVKRINGIISGAKEKTEQAKIVANDKIEEIKKSQEEAAERKKQQEEERKEKDAEIDRQKVEQEKEKEEKKQREAEEKRIK